MTKELRVNIGDLRRLTVECGVCHMGIALDLNEAKAAIPDECPGCGQKLEEQARAVKAIRQLYLDLRHSPWPVFFQIAEDAR
jgi:hypothetical protein